MIKDFKNTSHLSNDKKLPLGVSVQGFFSEAWEGAQTRNLWGGGFSSPIHRKGKKNPRGKKKPSCIKADVHVVSSDILSVTANLL